ncbi:MAG: DNA/RNA helicase domain-containing protein, partial [Verrucomicrobiales bacterium]
MNLNIDFLGFESPSSKCSHLNAYYSAPLEQFLQTSEREILGTMAHNGNFSLELTQRNAWEAEIQILKDQLSGLEGHLFLEFEVPRIGSRIDAVVALGPILFILEFKVGESAIHSADLNQAWDYALDLKNFHEGSHPLKILPLLIATNAAGGSNLPLEHHRDGVFRPLSASTNEIRKVIQSAIHSIDGPPFTAEEWARSVYKPTPTIIEAAQRLFAKNSVDAITRSDAGKQNLAVTAKSVEAIVEKAQTERKKVIIFVTGVPGAGKTLVGLTIATNKRGQGASHAVFLSGNGPLVEVLNEALTQDEYERTKDEIPRPRKGDIRQKVKAFIQNVHHFRDDGIRSTAAPSDHVVIFDEAQRAWNKEMTSDFMQRKKGLKNFEFSEPEFLISYMDRRKDWAAVICLVGGGQEINRGEAGISAWLDAIRERFSGWEVYMSDSLTDKEYAAGNAITHLRGVSKVNFAADLHLRTSIRSFRAENVSNFVKALLDMETELAREHLAALRGKFP